MTETHQSGMASPLSVTRLAKKGGCVFTNIFTFNQNPQSFDDFFQHIQRHSGQQPIDARLAVEATKKEGTDLDPFPLPYQVIN